MGSLVKTEMLKQNQQQINVGDLSNGIYMIEIKSKRTNRKTKTNNSKIRLAAYNRVARPISKH